MGKKINVIEINGRRYDAYSGQPIDHSQPIVVHHAPTAPVTSHHQRAARQPAKKLSRHAPQRSTTLMRRAVKKPSAASPKRHIKAQGHTGNLVARPATPIVPKLSFGNLDPKRLRHASDVKKSQLITHFNLSQSDYTTVTVTVTKSSPAPAAMAEPKRQRQPVPEPDATDIFERAVQKATSHLEPAPKTHKKRRLHLTRKHA